MMELEMTGEERGGTTMAMRFKNIPSPLVEATRRNDSTVILNPSSLDNLHLVKQAHPISGRNPHPDPDQNPHPDPDQYSDPDPPPPPPPGFAAAANTPLNPPPPPQQRQQQQASAAGLNVIIMYKECLKNHAANMGGHVVDGCGEFMPAGGGDDVDGSETSLKCAACNCHRNFHRKEVEGEASPPYNSAIRNGRVINNPQIPIINNQAPTSVQAPSGHNHHRYHHNYPAGLMMAFGGGGAAAESSSEDLNMLHSSGGGGQLLMMSQQKQQQQQQQQPIMNISDYSSPRSKKRFRTKFTGEQKEKMHELAEHLGWKIQKQSEELVKKFCNEYGVKRQVFKVWMHNNKQAIKKKQQQQQQQISS